MARDNLILDRYDPLGMAGSGGFGTVQIAWDPRIQRRVAIKTIELTDQDAYRAALPGASAVAAPGYGSGAVGYDSATAPGYGSGAVGYDSATAPGYGSAAAGDGAYGSAAAGDGAYAPPGVEAAYAGEWRGVQPWSEYLAEADSLAGTGPFAETDPFAETGSYAQAGSLAQVDPPDEVHALAHLPGLDEARTAAMLADPRIVTVYDFEIRGRTAYLIMEYVEGLTLSRLLADHEPAVTLDVIAAVFDSVAGALSIAHDAGVLHLDIKPDNILINARGEVKVTDFGLATLADASGAGTTGGGTIGYMPLEQMRREHLDARTDEWSLAAVTYEMLTGENPFRAEDLEHAEQAIEDAELVLPSLCWERIDDQIDDVVFYALDPDREERYATVRDFAEEAEKFLGDPVDGKDQLATIVSEALGLNDEEEPEEVESEQGDSEIRSGWREVAPLALLRTLLDRSPSDGDGAAGDEGGYEGDYDDGYYDEGDEGYDGESSARAGGLRLGGGHVALRDRVSSQTIAFLSRVFAVVASGFVALLAASNIPMLDVFGSGSIAVICAFAIAGAGLGAVRPDVGALASFGLLGVTLITNGAFVPALVFAAALGAWWYAIGRESMAASNVALALPLIGAVGGSSALPLLAGVSMRPLQAMATAAFGAACAVLFAAFGSLDVIGWNALSNWDFTRVDITGNLIAVLTRPSTWCIVASWIAAAGLQSILSTAGRRWLEIAGIVLAAAVVIGVSVLFGLPTAQVVASVVIAALALVAVIA